MDKSVPLIRAPELWNRGITGKGIIVGVGDTGFTSHKDLDGVVIKKIPYEDGSTKDGYGHGTAVSSVIAGQGTKSNGKYKGVAPDAKIIMAKVLGDDGGGSYESIINGMQALADAGVDIINLSLGADGPADGTDPLSLYVDYLTSQYDITTVCAAGNADGKENSMMVGSPAVARSAIAVAACGKDKTIAEFSSRGPSADGRNKPEVTAPGGKNAVTHWIIMARAPGTTMGVPISADYISAPGTSFASPHVAGLCALLKQAHPEAAPEALREMLVKGAGGSEWKSDFGYGVVDAVKSLNGGGDGGEPEPPPILEVWFGASIDQGKRWYVITKIPVKLGTAMVRARSGRFVEFLRRLLPQSTFEYVQAIIALSVTFAYLGMLAFSLVNSFIPAYATAFNVLIDWSIVPGIIWGFYFGSTVYKTYRAYTG
jgi:subtilisin family serine protease